MLALAIISTVVLGILLLIFCGVSLTDEDNFKVGIFCILALAFVIVSIWILYAR